jgi:protein tyrosine/serine phosphatase
MSITPDSYKKEFVNFREVCVGEIAPKLLYRSSHPARLPETDFTLAKLAEDAEINAVINLSDNEIELTIKADRIPWYHYLFKKGRIIALDMGFNYKSDQFSFKLYTGFKFILEHDGPYLIHCLQGIDRTGFMAMILEMLMGADKEEITDDYMRSFLEKPDFEKNSERCRLEKDNFVKVLEEVNDFWGIPKEDGFAKAAENYLLKKIGLSMDEINLLKLTLSKKQLTKHKT